MFQGWRKVLMNDYNYFRSLNKNVASCINCLDQSYKLVIWLVITLSNLLKQVGRSNLNPKPLVVYATGSRNIIKEVTGFILISCFMFLHATRPNPFSRLQRSFIGRKQTQKEQCFVNMSLSCLTDTPGLTTVKNLRHWVYLSSPVSVCQPKLKTYESENSISLVYMTRQ